MTFRCALPTYLPTYYNTQYRKAETAAAAAVPAFHLAKRIDISLRIFIIQMDNGLPK